MPRRPFLPSPHVAPFLFASPRLASSHFASVDADRPPPPSHAKSAMSPAFSSRTVPRGRDPRWSRQHAPEPPQTHVGRGHAHTHTRIMTVSLNSDHNVIDSEDFDVGTLAKTRAGPNIANKPWCLGVAPTNWPARGGRRPGPGWRDEGCGLWVLARKCTETRERGDPSSLPVAPPLRCIWRCTPAPLMWRRPRSGS